MPSIVVTYDEHRQPSRPPRRSESLRIRPSNSTPDFYNEAEEAAAARVLQRQQPPAPAPPPMAVSAASPPMRIPVVRIQSEEEDGDQWVGSLPTPPTPETTQQPMAAASSTTANDEMAKKMAVMKIKQGGIPI